MLRTIAAAILFCAPVALLAIPGDDTPVKIILPIEPVITEPPAPIPPTPSPVVITDLQAEEWYVIESTVELIVRQSPDGMLSIDQDAGPVILRGKFADGLGKVERRKYSSAYVYFIAAAEGTSGQVELSMQPRAKSKMAEAFDADGNPMTLEVVVQSGARSEADIVRQVLTVSGLGPQPPPDPEPKPDPEPDPTPKVKNVSLAIVEDTMNTPPETAIVLNGVANWPAFVDAGNDWRRYDLTTGEEKGKKAITDLNGPVPGLVIYDKATGTMIHRGDFPDTFDELKTLIGGLTNGG